MLTLTARRAKGSAQVGSRTIASNPNAHAERATAPMFSWSLDPSSTSRRRVEESTSSSVGPGLRSTAASPPRCTSKPATALMTSAGAMYTGAATGSTSDFNLS